MGGKGGGQKREEFESGSGNYSGEFPTKKVPFWSLLLALPVAVLFSWGRNWGLIKQPFLSLE